MSLQKFEPQPDKRIAQLEQELAALEAELNLAERELNTFIAQIRSKLHVQIDRVQELSLLYKQVQKAKKQKRLEQKEKGKHYREPQSLKKTEPDGPQEKPKADSEDQQELKRLYREAIRHVHPDKFVNGEAGKNERATALNVQLNDLYESGDLDELKGFYAHILSGNAMAHEAFQPTTVANPAALLAYLQKKKEELTRALQETQASELYRVLKTYADPQTFIPEVAAQFDVRIKQLEKRTRKVRKG